MITLDQLQRIMPAAPAGWVDPLNAAMDEFGIATPLQMAAFMAQAAHESGELKRLEETLNYSAQRLLQVWPRRFTREEAAAYARQPERIANRAYSGRMGNGNEASGDGWRYRGRGIFQLTGRDNYRRAASALGLGLLADPDQLLRPINAARSAGWFWSDRGLNALAETRYFERITAVINGPAMLGAKERYAYYVRAKSVLGWL